jgi:ribose 5-phosphate isomerase A
LPDRWKRAAAEAAVALVEDGMTLGLGTGSTAAAALEALAGRLRAGLRIAGGVPTSDRTAEHARRLGIPLTDFAAHPELDLTIDGADEIERAGLALIKGGGGALLREKIVAAASRRLVIVADDTKLVDRLGRFRLPVEVVPFGWEVAARRLGALGVPVELRRGLDGTPYLTDCGHFICDCPFGSIDDPAGLERTVRQITGVVDCGLFIGLATDAIVAGPGGTRRLTRT